jgi:hypothetical protein
MIYEVQKPEDATFAVMYNGEATSIASIIYMVSAQCRYEISVTVRGREPQQKYPLNNSITIRIAGDGQYGNSVFECLTLHKDEYLLASQKGKFTIVGPNEFNAAYNIIDSMDG